MEIDSIRFSLICKVETFIVFGMIRLSKHLQQSGIASRRKAEELIFQGKVTVNGEKVLVPETRVDPYKDKVSVEGKTVTLNEEKVYFLLNKPKGMLCTAVGTGRSNSVLELFKEEGIRLFTVGRLDKDTEGLLLVTNDGDFANDVIHPSHNREKEYLAKTAQEVTHEHLIKISGGSKVEGVYVKPIRVEKVRRGTVKITVGEGKKREVRIMLQEAGLELLSLTRIRLGPLLLGALPVGQYRPLTANEMLQLKKANPESHES